MDRCPRRSATPDASGAPGSTPGLGVCRSMGIGEPARLETESPWFQGLRSSNLLSGVNSKYISLQCIYFYMLVTAALVNAAFAQGAAVSILHWVAAFIADMMIAGALGGAASQ